MKRLIGSFRASISKRTTTLTIRDCVTIPPEYDATAPTKEVNPIRSMA